MRHVNNEMESLLSGPLFREHQTHVKHIGMVTAADTTQWTRGEKVTVEFLPFSPRKLPRDTCSSVFQKINLGGGEIHTPHFTQQPYKQEAINTVILKKESKLDEPVLCVTASDIYLLLRSPMTLCFFKSNLSRILKLESHGKKVKSNLGAGDVQVQHMSLIYCRTSS